MPPAAGAADAPLPTKKRLALVLELLAPILQRFASLHFSPNTDHTRTLQRRTTLLACRSGLIAAPSSTANSDLSNQRTATLVTAIPGTIRGVLGAAIVSAFMVTLRRSLV